MKKYGIFILAVAVALGASALGGLALFPKSNTVVAPANISESILPVAEEVRVPVVASASIEATTTTIETTTTPQVAEQVPTKIVPTEIVAPPATISLAASSGLQGNPVKIIILGTKNVDDIISVVIDGTNLPVFSYQDTVQSVYGIDLNHKTGDFPIEVKLKDRATISGTLAVIERKKPTYEFTIPESLGGTNPAGEKNVVTLLAKESQALKNLATNPKKLWVQTFIYPTQSPIITDPYGYNRDTGTLTIIHKGTDFRAPVGTPVYAINRGVVRLIETFSIYGKTVVIDHGQGIQSFYMHLSKISAPLGTVVSQGQKIGESGATGYAESPHLHLTVRANGVSIDPIAFFSLYGFPLAN
jgi:murein DD-endopeptidase MepM/ murein hydrolase activator NlpD